jgi:hypothetical protein
MELQERDIDITETVHRHRIMRHTQLQALFFDSPTPAKKRLALLYDHHYLERLIFPVFVGSSPTLYLLGEAGAKELRKKPEYSDLRWYPSSFMLKREKAEHTLAVNDTFLAVVLACRKLGYECDLWMTERELKADYDRVTISTSNGKSESVAVIPDSYFTIVAHKDRYPFFLELDRGTMTLARFKDKIRAYVAYRQSGGYAKRYGTKSLRVLTVVSTEATDGGERRMQELVKATEATTSVEWFWFTTLKRLTVETIFHEPIWYQVGNDEPVPLIPKA